MEISKLLEEYGDGLKIGLISLVVAFLTMVIAIAATLNLKFAFFIGIFVYIVFALVLIFKNAPAGTFSRIL